MAYGEEIETEETDLDNEVVNSLSNREASVSTEVRQGAPPLNKSFNPDRAIQFFSENPWLLIKPSTAPAANAMFSRAGDMLRIRSATERVEIENQKSKNNTAMALDFQKTIGEVMPYIAGNTNIDASLILPDDNGNPPKLTGKAYQQAKSLYNQFVVPAKEAEKSKTFAPTHEQQLIELRDRLKNSGDVDSANQINEILNRRGKGVIKPEDAAVNSRLKEMQSSLDKAEVELAKANSGRDKIKKAEAQAGVDAIRNQMEKLKGATTETKQPSNAPEVGTVLKGYKFKGGNPADKNNWEKAQ